MPYQWGLPEAPPLALPATPEQVTRRCFTCRAATNVSRDEETRERVCLVCWGEKHREHYAAYCARLGLEDF